MPTYSYRCSECSTAFDIHQSFSDASLTVCPTCGGALRKVFNTIGVSFNGSGFYRNDSRAKPAGEKQGAGNSDGEKSGTDKSGSEKSGTEKAGAEKASTGTKTEKSGGTKERAASTAGSSSGGGKGAAKAAS